VNREQVVGVAERQNLARLAAEVGRRQGSARSGARRRRRTIPSPSSEDRTMSASEIKVGQLGIRYIVDGSATSSLGMFELTVPAGSNVPPPHSHTDNEECVYVLEGTLRYTVDAETRDLPVGQTMRTPRGAVHAFSNPFAATARALIVMSPDVGAQYFRDVATVINAGGPPDKTALVAVMSRYGLVPAPPTAAPDPRRAP
jgi:quercetin dioxygenase-like cupin family protein